MHQKLPSGKKNDDQTYEPLNIMPERVNADLESFEGFTLEYNVEWPLSIIISKKNYISVSIYIPSSILPEAR